MSDDTSGDGKNMFLPVTLIALVLFLSLASQTTQALRDRDTLHHFMGGQDKPLEESQKLQVQLSALMLGTKKLAEGGDKNAAAIINRLQESGITIGDSHINISQPSALPPIQP